MATLQSAGIEGQMMAMNQMIGMQVKFQALLNKLSQAHSKTERLEEHLDEMEEKIAFLDLSGRKLEKVEALLVKKKTSLEDAMADKTFINAQLESLQTSMDEAIVGVVHNPKKQTVNKKCKNSAKKVVDLDLDNDDDTKNQTPYERRKDKREHLSDSDSFHSFPNIESPQKSVDLGSEFDCNDNDSDKNKKCAATLIGWAKHLPKQVAPTASKQS